MSVVLMLASVPMSSMAADRNTESVEAYLSLDNLQVVATQLLTDISDRGDEITPTALNLSFTFVKALQEQAKADGIDYNTATSQQLATSLLNYADKALADANLNSKIPSIVRTLIPKIDLNSVNGILNTLVLAGNLVSGKKTYGDLQYLDVTMFKSGKNAIQRSSSNDYTIIMDVFKFLGSSKTKTLVEHALSGNFTMGSTIDKAVDIKKVNEQIANLGSLIKKAIYEGLLAEKTAQVQDDGKTKYVIKTAYADSDYASYTADELLAAALVNVATNKDYTKGGANKKVLTVSKDECDAALKMNLAQLIGKYGQAAYETYAVDALNVNLKDTLTKALEKAPEVKAVVEKIVDVKGYKFTNSTIDFSSYASAGIAESINNILVDLVNTLLTSDAKKATALEKGDNSKLDSNIRKLLGYALKTFATTNGGKFYGYDFSKFANDATVNAMTSEQMAVEVLKMFYPGWFGSYVSNDGLKAADSLEKMAVLAVDAAVSKWMPDQAATVKLSDFEKATMNNGVVKNLSQAKYYDEIASIGMKVAEYWLDKSTNYTASYKSEWTEELDDIVNWALNYIKGVPAVADGLADSSYGPFYKLDVVLNELFSLSFLNGAGDDATFTFDTENFFMNKLFPAITDVKSEDLLKVFYTNTNADNPFNNPFVSSTIKTVDSLLFALLEHTDNTKSNAEHKATYWSAGYKISSYDAKSGKYLSATKTSDPLAIDSKEEPTSKKEPTSKDEPTSKKEPTSKEEPSSDKPVNILYGDANGDGKVNAVDARLVLRCSAKLVTFDADQIVRCDVNGDGKVNAVDARLVLRLSAKLISSLPIENK